MQNLIRSLLILSILIIEACGKLSPFPMRAEGSCLESKKHGGPLQVIQVQGAILHMRTSTGEIKKLPNDLSWSETDC